MPAARARHRVHVLATLRSSQERRARAPDLLSLSHERAPKYPAAVWREPVTRTAPPRPAISATASSTASYTSALTLALLPPPSTGRITSSTQEGSAARSPFGFVR